MVYIYIFIIMKIMFLLSCFAVINVTKTLHAVFMLIISFTFGACICIFLEAYFVGFLFIIVYVGAVSVLFDFFYNLYSFFYNLYSFFYNLYSFFYNPINREPGSMITEQDLQDTYIKFSTNFDLGTTFQDPATPIAEAIIDLYHYISFYLVLVLAFVIVIFIDIFLNLDKNFVKEKKHEVFLKFYNFSIISFVKKCRESFNFKKKFEGCSVSDLAVLSWCHFQIFIMGISAICSLSEQIAYAETLDVENATSTLGLSFRSRHVHQQMNIVVEATDDVDGFLKPLCAAHGEPLPFQDQLILLTRILTRNTQHRYLIPAPTFSQQYMIGFERSLVGSFNHSISDVNETLTIFRRCQTYIYNSPANVNTNITNACALNILFETQRTNITELYYKSLFIEHIYKTFGTNVTETVIQVSPKLSLIRDNNFLEFRSKLVDYSLALRSLQLEASKAFIEYFDSIYEVPGLLSATDKLEIQQYIQENFPPRPEARHLLASNKSNSVKLAFFVAANIYDYPDMYTHNLPSRNALILSELSVSEPPLDIEIEMVKKIAAQGFNPTKPISEKPFWKVNIDKKCIFRLF